MINLGYFRAAAALTMVAMMSSAAVADEWIAERLRGTVKFLQGSEWVTLERGAVIADGASVQTGSDGRVELLRGAERIAIAPNSQIAIRDAGTQKMTNVVQHYGAVTIEAERRNIQHFSVQTPVLAAVVKGTQFTVTYRNGQARVDVERGVVQVQDSGHDMVVDVAPGQWAQASMMRPLDIAGPGAEKAVFLIGGEVVPAAARDAVLDGQIAPEDAAAAVTGGTLQAGFVGQNQNRGVGNGNSGNGNAFGRNAEHAGNGNAYGRNNDNPGNGNAGQGNNGRGGGNGNGNSGNGQGNGGNGQGNGNGNSGGNGNNGNSGNNGNGNGNGGNQSAVGSSDSGSSSGNNGNGNGNGNGGSNGNGNGGGNGNSDNGNSGNGNDRGNGNGKGND